MIAAAQTQPSPGGTATRDQIGIVLVPLILRKRAVASRVRGPW